jgi:hypothetical protein
MKNAKLMALSKSQEMCSFKTDYKKKSMKVQLMAFSNISIYSLHITTVLFLSQATEQKLVLQGVFLSPDYSLWSGRHRFCTAIKNYCSDQSSDKKVLYIHQMNGLSKESYLILLLRIARLSQWNTVYIDILIDPNFARKLVEFFGIRWLRIQVFLDVISFR